MCCTLFALDTINLNISFVSVPLFTRFSQRLKISVFAPSCCSLRHLFITVVGGRIAHSIKAVKASPSFFTFLKVLVVPHALFCLEGPP